MTAFVRGTCLLALAASSGCGSSGQTSHPDADACPDTASPPAGTVVAGGACADPASCAVGAGQIAVCDSSNRTEQQQKLLRCHLLVPARAGEPCAASQTTGGALQAPTFDDVAAGDFPIMTGFCRGKDLLGCSRATHTCQPLATLGEGCADIGCVPAAYCAGGTCAARLPAGKPCQSIQDFLDQSWCDDQSFCDIVTDTCTPRLTDGAACSLDRACVSNNCRRNVCAATAACF